MKVSDLFVKCLENEGVRYVFGVPGEETEDLLFSLERSSIKFIPTRHEQGAAFMADVWGRLSGRAGVCLATLGPGATNLVTGVADANLDKSPVVAITAQAGLNRVTKESHQYVDIVAMFRPITKWNASIPSPDVVPEVVRKAFKVAETEKPGATHIELSEDMAAAESDQQAIPVREVRRPDPDRQALDETVALIGRAKRPLVLAGNGSVRKQTSEQLRRLTVRHPPGLGHPRRLTAIAVPACATSTVSSGSRHVDLSRPRHSRLAHPRTRTARRIGSLLRVSDATEATACRAKLT